ncbi:uncharacterized protein UV8b_03078 [Ustilaginoidea virens]|uniref:Uncharacterized protein n=1 Tax=Ustilaginoidea virens TaxID=1159556 RepID=A0A8E5HP16_USTVR|nr:uncharacterized protein UV8b_03078 [Ustilaginoidea virens]QUC18837.1 hypothetical protein UV8b_03078 [Ustilaginoidea virens]
MFALPDAKRVRREDLNQPDGLASGDAADAALHAELQARLDAQMAKSLGMHTHAHVPDAAPPPPNQPREDDGHGAADADVGEFDFRLFRSAGAPARVVLEQEPTAQQAPGGLVRRRDPSSYLPRVPDARRQEYRLAAVSGEHVLARSARPCWGLQLPWKVERVAVTRKAGPGDQDAAAAAARGSEEGGRRARTKRLGKRRRIAVRARIKALRDKEAADASRALGKEEHLKEKKKRLNRAKKLRRRARDRETKASQGGDGDGE